MVILNRIYTRTGDDGTTALSSGERRKKHDLRVSAYGTVDEANACIGLARLHTGEEDAEIDAVLGIIQNDLFDLGADLSTPEPEGEAAFEPLRIVGAQVTRLETEIDRMNKRLRPLRTFVLPGGTKGAAALHLARTVTRRAEREAVRLAESEAVNAEAIRYLNRLSDLLFVAARCLNANGEADRLWVPGQNR